MRTISYVIPIVVLLAAAHGVQAQQVDCQTVEFSAAVTQKFPRVREACLEVIERQGQLLAVFKADLLKVSGNKVRIRAKLPGGGQAEAQTVQVPPERRVLVDGKKYRVNELSLGQELTIYARVDEPVAALAPAEASESLAFVPIEVEPLRVAAAEPEMPATASELPALGLLGALLICLAIALELLRRVRKLRSFTMSGRVAGPSDQSTVSAMPSSRIPVLKGESR